MNEGVCFFELFKPPSVPLDSNSFTCWVDMAQRHNRAVPRYAAKQHVFEDIEIL